MLGVWFKMLPDQRPKICPTFGTAGVLLLVAALLVGMPWGAAAASEGEETVTSGQAESKAPWRGSAFVYRNTLRAYSLDAASELSHNPYYAMSFSFQPSWWFGDHLYVRASLDVIRELTNSDETTDYGEAWVSDLAFIVGYSKFYKIPVVGIDISADLVIKTPTSKPAMARTLIMGIGPGLRITRSFDLLKGLSIGYSFRANPNLHRKTTSETENPWIGGCISSSGGCDQYFNTGYRNAKFRLHQGFDVSLGILDWLSVSLSYGVLIDWLYDIDKSDDQYEILQISEPQNRRYYSVFEAQVTFTPMPAFQVGLGLSTFNPQLKPDSDYYNPLFNRYSMIFVDMRLSIDGLISQITND